jgi:hypothetical protein
MAPHLRVLAGTSPNTMVPITHVVNRGISHRVSSSLFEGEIVAYIKGFTPSEQGVGDAAKIQSEEPEYFRREDRQGITWSIQVKGAIISFISLLVGWKPEAIGILLPFFSFNDCD